MLGRGPLQRAEHRAHAGRRDCPDAVAQALEGAGKRPPSCTYPSSSAFHLCTHCPERPGRLSDGALSPHSLLQLVPLRTQYLGAEDQGGAGRRELRRRCPP